MVTIKNLRTGNSFNYDDEVGKAILKGPVFGKLFTAVDSKSKSTDKPAVSKAAQAKVDASSAK